MAWETRRNGRKYYYRGRRINGRFVKEYYGAGPLAELAALQDEARQQLRRDRKRQSEEAKAKLSVGDAATEACRTAPLMKPRTMKSPANSCPTVDSLPPEVAQRVRELEAQRASKDPRVDAELVELINAYPALALTCGDLGQQAIAAWLDLTAGPNRVFRAALEQKLEQLRRQFVAVTEDPAGRMIIDRVLATWLQVAYADGRMAQAEGIDRAGLEFLARRQQQAQRQHLAAIQAWRQWRRLADEWVSPPETLSNDSPQLLAEKASDEPCILPFPRRATA